MKDAEKVIITVDLQQIPAFRLLLWSLREVLKDMRDKQDYEYAERISKAIERFMEETDT